MSQTVTSLESVARQPASRQIKILSNRAPIPWTAGGATMVLLSGLMQLNHDRVPGSDEWQWDLEWWATHNDVVADDAGPADRETVSASIRKASPIGKEVERPLPVRLFRRTQSQHHAFYDVVANDTVWPGAHGYLGTRTREELDAAWEPAIAVVRQEAKELVDACEDGATVLVEDYQMVFHVREIKLEAARQGKTLNVGNYIHIPIGSLQEMLDAFHEHIDPVADVSEYARTAPKLIEWLEACASSNVMFHCNRWAGIDDEPSANVDLQGLAPREVWGFARIYERLIGHPPPHGVSVFAAPVNTQDIITEAQNPAIRAAVERIEARFDGFDGYLVGTVGRADNKNGADILAKAMGNTWQDDKATVALEGAEQQPLAAVLSCPFTRDYVKDWEALAANRRQALAANPEGRIEHLYGETPEDFATGKFTPKKPDRADAVAMWQVCDIMVVPSRRGGRDIVGIEPQIGRLSERPLVMIVSEEAAIAETVGGFLAEQSRVVAHDDKGNPIREFEGNGFVQAAIVVKDMNHPDPNVAARSLADALHEARRILDDPERALAITHAARATAALENPHAFMSFKLSVARNLHLQRGVLAIAGLHDVAHRLLDGLNTAMSSGAATLLHRQGFEKAIESITVDDAVVREGVTSAVDAGHVDLLGIGHQGPLLLDSHTLDESIEVPTQTPSAPSRSAPLSL